MDARPRPGDVVLHPVVLAAIVGLVLNDHVLKQAFPGVVTGKLSDVCGMVFFPLLLVGLIEVVGRAAAKLRAPDAAGGPARAFAPSWRVAVVAVVATGVVFALTKTVPAWADGYRVVLGALQWPARAVVALARGESAPALGRVLFARDPTDLVALPALALPLWIARARVRRVERA